MWHGAAHIAGLYPLRTAEQDFLTYGAGLVKGLGFDTIKLEMSITYSSIKYINQAFGSPSTLTQLAQETAFASVFADPAFARYVLTSFSLADSGNNPWAGQWTKSRGDTQEAEYAALCEHLAATYPAKEFLLANWEGDWQLLNSFNPADAVPQRRLQAYCDWHRRRSRVARGVGGSIKYAIECNRILDGWGERVHRSVLERVPHDYVSWSCYEAIEGWHQGLSQAAFEADIEAKLTEGLRRIRRSSNAPVYLGEYGWPINMPSFSTHGYDVGALWQTVIDVADSLGMVGQIPWQILDNEEQSPGVPRGFGLYNRNANSNVVGSLNASGTFFQGFL